MQMHRNKSVDAHQFALVPKADIPRSTFKRQFTHKTTMDAGYLVPIMVDEVLPGDSFNVRATIFARMSTPLFPVMDNLHLDTFYFFVPSRLVWENFVKMEGETDNPGDSTSYVLPTMTSPVGGYDPLTIYDYLGLPTKGQVDPAGTVTHQVLPLRAYNKILKDWFQDENLNLSPVIRKGDTGDLVTDYALVRRGKRHDYFTSCLPWTQKGQSVSIPLGSTAPVIPASAGAYPTFDNTSGPSNINLYNSLGTTTAAWSQPGAGTPVTWNNPGLMADLSTATAATINQLRQAFQVQKLLERDARGGTRYTEHLKASWGVTSPDFRLQRAEFLGSGSTLVNINPIAQTSGSGTYTDTPLGTLSGYGTALGDGNGFSAHFTEHGFVIGLASVRADLTYQQGIRKMWTRSNRFDHYIPVFANLGEQAVLNEEIYCQGLPVDKDVFGYQERWAEYRYFPSMITGLFKSTTTGTIDAWHLAQHFTSLPTLNSEFIRETPPMDRVLAVGQQALGQHFIVDMFFDMHTTRLMPIYSVPGLIDHL